MPETDSTIVQSGSPVVVSTDDLRAFSEFFQRVRPVIEYLEREKGKLPPQLRVLLETNADCELTPSEVTRLLEETDIPADMMADVAALAEDAERSLKWEQDCKAFLAQVITATSASKTASSGPKTSR
ncbi:hypothetical protein C8Q80DRAFT_1272631 [Daedaleopsis nitida]|nr:hypothetical protein C8Q80DRAFT_1272631 [Daedaleopsis nitida]